VPPSDDPLWRTVAEDLTRAVEGRLDLTARLAAVKSRYRPPEPDAPGPPPGVTASNLISPNFTAVEVTARDRPALLADLAHSFAAAGFTIQHAVIATRGTVVMDTFYISRPDGRRPEIDELLGLLADLESQI
jgi:[protein-PII] uridylyltransferase